jgi:outer membrane lipoprotein-sorting protein
VVSVCCACAAARPAAPPGGEAAAPTPAALETHLRSLDSALASFQGQGRLEYHGPDGKLRSSSMVVVKAPDKVRIDFRTPFSITYTVVTDGSKLVAYDRGEKVLYRGSPTPRNFGRYTRVPVDLSMLASLVRGLPPLPARAGEGDIGRVPEGWRWESPLLGGGRLAIVFAAEDWRPLSAALSGSQAGDFTAYFEEYEEVGGMPAAHRIRAELPDGGRVDLSYGTVWRDRAHSDAAFRLEPPAGVRVVEMDAT